MGLQRYELSKHAPKCVPDAGIPAEYGMEDAVEVGEVQRVRHSYQPNDHWVDIAENCSQNQPFEGCCWHVSSLRSTPDLELLSVKVIAGSPTGPVVVKSHYW